METQASTYKESGSYIPKLMLVVVILIAVSFVLLKVKLNIFIPIVIAAIVILSLRSYDYNYAFLYITLHAASMLDPLLDEYVSTARWVLLALFAFRIFIPSDYYKEKINFTYFHLGACWIVFFAVIGNITAFAQPISLYRTISLIFLFFAVCFSLWRYLFTYEKIVNWIEIHTSVAAIFIFVGFFSKQNWMNIINVAEVRFQGVYINPNTLGVTLIASVPFALYLSLYNRNRSATKRWFFLIVFLTGLLQLLMSGSRASIGGLFIASSFVMYLYYQKRAFIVIPLIIAIVYISYGLIENVLSTNFYQILIYRKSTLDSVGGREELWRLAFKLFKQKPFMGYGFGTNEQAMMTGGKASLIDLNIRFGMQTHNCILRSLLDIGIIGTMPLFLLFVFLPIKISRLLFRTESKELSMLIATLSIVCLASLINCLFESWLFSVGSIHCFIFWACVALLYKIDQNTQSFVGSDRDIRNVAAINK